MTDIAIQAEHLGKEYVIGGPKERYLTLRDSLVAAAKSPFRKLRPPSSRIWALKDVSFEIKQGEAIGIIGRNGAGKSTLLKILSRITEPTEGRVRLKGRVASLLEVGTGFHPELTGRENIYLNGAILGMTKAEIKGKFDEIVDFAEIEKFLDTPVKRYSSGMYVRLAFAVAAHLQTEILVVDEVLAVGDSEFQKKCLGKMGQLTSGGRTVLLVSHNMAAIQNLCRSGMWLLNGRLESIAKNSRMVVQAYQRSFESLRPDNRVAHRMDRRGSQRLKFAAISFGTESNPENQNSLVCGRPATITLDYEAKEPIKNISVAIAFGSEIGENKLVLSTEHLAANYTAAQGGGSFECRIPRLPLPPGRYYVTIYSQSSLEVLDWIREACLVEVLDGDFFNTGILVSANSSGVLTDHAWT